MVSTVAPPHSSNEFHSGRKVVSVFQIASELPRLHVPGSATESEASVSKEASTTQSRGTRNAAPMITIATPLAAVAVRSRGPFRVRRNVGAGRWDRSGRGELRSEEHTSELQS